VNKKSPLPERQRALIYRFITVYAPAPFPALTAKGKSPRRRRDRRLTDRRLIFIITYIT
jgi:hypothetical protein